jgi:uncharacterized protein (TIGR00266 family)
MLAARRGYNALVDYPSYIPARGTDGFDSRTIRAAPRPNSEAQSIMRYEISGTVMQTVGIDLDPGESIYSQTNSMAWMSDTIDMNTHTGGGLFASIKRSLTGGSFFITDFTARTPGHIAFAPRFPGSILAKRLQTGEHLICRKETFLCAEKSVSLELAWQRRIGAGFFGGEGFILQKVTGPGVVWLDLSGEVVERSLAPYERLLVHAGHVGIQEPSVQFDIQLVPGFRNILFGGEGLYLATLTGPGRVWLQSMPIMNLAEEVGRYLPGYGSHDGSGSVLGNTLTGAAAVATVGSLLGGLLGKNDEDR